VTAPRAGLPAQLDRLRRRAGSDGLSRRHVMRLAVAAASIHGISIGRARAAESGIRFDGWGGVVRQAFHEAAFVPFTAKTGIRVTEGTFGDEITFLNQVRTSQPGDFNLFQSPGVLSYKRYVDLGWNVAIDEANVPNLGLIMAPMLAALRQVTPVALSAVPYSYGTTGIAFNTKYLSLDEVRRTGPAILLDPRFKGRLGALNDMQTRVWYGALQSGQDPNDIKDMDAVWDKARQSRDLVLRYWEAGAELMDLLGREEIVLTEAFSGRVAALQRQGYPIGYYNPPGTLTWIDDIFVLKGSPMPEAEALLNFMLEPDIAIGVAEREMYAPCFDPAKVALPDSIRQLPAFDPTGRLESLKLADPVYWLAQYERWERRWSHILKGA
jgi:spermidine/putrescine transport system substrate-binding protein